MADELIEHFLNRGTFAEDAKFGIEQLAILQAAYDKLKASFNTLQGAGAGKSIASSVANATPIIENLSRAITAQTTAINQNVTAQNNLASSSTQLAKEKQKLTQLTTDEAKQLAVLKLEQQQQAKANKDAAIETLGLKDAYQKLNAEYVKAAQHAKNIAVTHGIDSKAAKDASASAKVLSDRLKEIDSNVGQNQRNVGNYGSAIDKLGNAFQSAFNRIVAYASVTAIFDFFKDTVSSAAEAEQEVARFKNTLDGLGRLDVFDRLSKQADAMAERFKYIDNEDVLHVFDQLITYGKLTENQITELTPVIINFAAKSGLSLQEAGETITRAIESGKGLKGYGLDLKGAGTEAERLNLVLTTLKDKVDGAADAFGETTQGKIAASKQQFQNLKEEIGNGLLPVMNKVLEGLNGMIKGFQKMVQDGIGTVLSRTLRGIRQHITGNIAEFNQDQIDRANAEKHQAMLDKQQADYDAAILKASGEGDKILGTGGETKDKKVAAKKAQLQQLKELLNTEFDIYKVHQEALIKTYDDDVKSDKIHYLDKLAALDNYVKAQKELLDKQEAYDIAQKKAEAARSIQHLQEEKVGKSGAEKSRINENIVIEEKNLQQAILLIRANTAEKEAEIIENGSNTRQNIIDKELASELKSYEDFQKEEQGAVDRSNDLIKKGFEKRAAIEAENAKKQLDAQKELRDKKIQLAEEAESFLFSIAGSSFDKQLNSITNEKNAITERTAHALAANDALLQSEQQKAANVVIINARAQAQQEALDKKARDVKNQQAKFDRAEAIFQIGIQTLKTIFEIQAKAAAAAPFGAVFLAQIPLVIATSALSIGAILAKPLPKFKHGKDSNYEGLAIVGDGGQPEYIRREDGSIEKTPAHDTLTYLRKNEIVYPDFMALMRSAAMPAISVFKGNNNNNDFQELKTAINRQIPLLQQIANKRENHILAKDGALVSVWKHGANLTKYIDENTNW